MVDFVKLYSRPIGQHEVMCHSSRYRRSRDWSPGAPRKYGLLGLVNMPAKFFFLILRSGERGRCVFAHTKRSLDHSDRPPRQTADPGTLIRPAVVGGPDVWPELPSQSIQRHNSSRSYPTQISSAPLQSLTRPGYVCESGSVLGGETAPAYLSKIQPPSHLS